MWRHFQVPIRSSWNSSLYSYRYFRHMVTLTVLILIWGNSGKGEYDIKGCVNRGLAVTHFICFINGYCSKLFLPVIFINQYQSISNWSFENTLKADCEFPMHYGKNLQMIFWLILRVAENNFFRPATNFREYDKPWKNSTRNVVLKNFGRFHFSDTISFVSFWFWKKVGPKLNPSEFIVNMRR